MVNLEKITADFKQAMLSLYGERLDKIVLYGSYARGDFHEDSDIDFLVVLKDKEIRAATEVTKTVEKISPIQERNNFIISVVHMAAEKFNSAKTPLLYWVRKEGVIV